MSESRQFKGSTKAKLSDEQWDELLEQIRNGMTVRDAVDYCKQQWNISYSQGSMVSNKRYKEFKELVRIEEGERIKGQLEQNLPYVVGLSLKTIEYLDKERDSLRKELSTAAKNSVERAKIETRLKEAERELRQYQDQYVELYGANQLPSYVNSKLVERDAQEVQDAIEAILDKLEKRLGPQTLADEVLAEEGLQ